MKKVINLSLLTTAVLVLVAICAPSLALAGQRVTVEKNHTLRVTLSGSAGSVVVGNSDIADVTVIDSRTIYIVGKGFGSSAVNVTGRDGRSLFDGEVTVTTAQHGAITVYKGLTPSLLVCSNICIAEDTNAANAQNAAPAGQVSLTPAPAPVMTTPGAAMVAQ